MAETKLQLTKQSPPKTSSTVEQELQECGTVTHAVGVVPTERYVYQGASGERFSDSEEKDLSEPIPDEYYDILPTGEVYVSHVHYRTILTKAFGRGRWAMVPLSPIVVQETTLCREYALMVAGRFISQAIGEAEYHSSNSRMSYATAAESLKSNALTRCCKDLNIASECWDRKWSSKFRKEKCLLVQRRYYDKMVYHWRLKTSEPFQGEVAAGAPSEKKQVATLPSPPPPSSAPSKPIPPPLPVGGSTQSSRTVFFAAMGSLGAKNDADKKKMFNDLLPEYASTKDVPDKLMQEVSAILKGCINEVNGLKVDDSGKFYVVDAGGNTLLPVLSKAQSGARGVSENDPF